MCWVENYRFLYCLLLYCITIKSIIHCLSLILLYSIMLYFYIVLYCYNYISSSQYLGALDLAHVFIFYNNFSLNFRYSLLSTIPGGSHFYFQFFNYFIKIFLIISNLLNSSYQCGPSCPQMAIQGP